MTIRQAREDDVEVLHRFVVELAEAEEFPGAVHARPDDLAGALFGSDPVARALLAEWDGEAIGFALYYFAYSTIMAAARCTWRTCTSSPSTAAGAPAGSSWGRRNKASASVGCCLRSHHMAWPQVYS